MCFGLEYVLHAFSSLSRLALLGEIPCLLLYDIVLGNLHCVEYKHTLFIFTLEYLMAYGCVLCGCSTTRLQLSIKGFWLLGFCQFQKFA